MQKRLDKIDGDSMEEYASWDVHHWQDRNPVVPEGMIQMAMGTPAAVYHGGLLHASVRYFDAGKKRPGLPNSVAALVSRIGADGITVELVNTDPLTEKRLTVQAGAFGEHRFTRAVPGGGKPIDIDGPSFTVELGPGAHVKIHIGLERFAGEPSYAVAEG